MNIALFSNLAATAQGGGGVYAWALACALAAEHRVDLYLPAAIPAAELQALFPDFGPPPTLKQLPALPGWPRLQELRQAWADRRYDRVIVQTPRVPRFTWNRQAVHLCEFPFTRTLSGPDRVRLRRYPLTIANSAYTAGWIQRRWQRAAVVLHPPVQPIAPAPAKRPMILAVGRFLAGNRSKRQLDLVRVFRELCEGGLRGWELHLAGFVQDQAYAQQTAQAAEGLPVTCHFGVTRDRLENLFREASVFWHAVGVDADPEREPERMEHFGIVTVEAMSAGCVPVVVNHGGQPEIVGRDTSAGFLWNSWAELRAQTARLTADPALCATLAAAARERSARFDFAHFRERVRGLFPT